MISTSSKFAKITERWQYYSITFKGKRYIFNMLNFSKLLRPFSREYQYNNNLSPEHASKEYRVLKILMMTTRFSREEWVLEATSKN